MLLYSNLEHSSKIKMPPPIRRLTACNVARCLCQNRLITSLPLVQPSTRTIKAALCTEHKISKKPANRAKTVATDKNDSEAQYAGVHQTLIFSFIMFMKGSTMP